MERAIKLIKNNKFLEALAVLEDLIKNEPYNTDALKEAGFCYSQIGKLAHAVNAYEQATLHNPIDSNLWESYGHILYKLGKISDSINALKKAAKYNPENIWTYHQIAFLCQRNKDYKSALNYLDKAVGLCNDRDHMGELLTLRAVIYENLDTDKAIDAYLSIIDQYEDNPDSYDRISSLIIDKYKFSDDLGNINSSAQEYNKATQLFRKGKIDKSIQLYKDIIKKDKYCYPAYLGISQALYEKKFGTREIDTFKAPDGISDLFKNYDELNKTEKNIINASVYPLEKFVKRLISGDSHFIIVPIDTRLTDYPNNQYLKDKKYENIPYHTLRGIGGTHAYVGIERLRDLLWDVPRNVKFTPACVAHEFAHQVWCLLDKNTQNSVKRIYNNAKKANSFISNYSSWNLEEYFAEYYAYYIRMVTSNLKASINDPMICVIEDLKSYK